MDITDASDYPGHADQLFTPKRSAKSPRFCGGLPREDSRHGLRRAHGSGGWRVARRRLGDFAHAPAQARSREGQRDASARESCCAKCKPPRPHSGQFYAPDPTENTSSIGGNIAANSSGSRSFRYGATRRHVLSLRVAFMDGSIAATFRRGEKIDFDVPRDFAAAHDQTFRRLSACARHGLVDLIIGSEGTLGVVTEAELQLLPAPGERLGGVVFFRIGSRRAGCGGSLAADARPEHDRVHRSRFARR